MKPSQGIMCRISTTGSVICGSRLSALKLVSVISRLSETLAQKNVMGATYQRGERLKLCW